MIFGPVRRMGDVGLLGRCDACTNPATWAHIDGGVELYLCDEHETPE